MSSKFSYKFSNLCGAVYKQGNVAFTRDGNSVLSPVGNRVSQFDLKNNTSCTFPFENQKNIYRFAVSPDGLIMISVDEEGRAVLVNLYKKVVLFHFNFKQRVYDIKYSPNGKYFAVTHGRRVQVWHAPGHTHDYSPFSLYRTYPGQYDDTMCIDWSQDSNFFAVGSRDTSCRIYSLHPLPGFHYVTLAAHRTSVITCFFQKDSLNLYTVAKDGALVIWECSLSLPEMTEFIRQTKQASGVENEATHEGESPQTRNGNKEGDEEENDEPVDSDSESELEGQNKVAMETAQTSSKRMDSSEDDDADLPEPPSSKRSRLMTNICHWSKTAKHLFNQDGARVTCATMHKPSSLLVVGFNSGVFSLYEMPDFNIIHTLSISQHRITSVAVNNTGEWLAFGCRGLGQLLVWEWQSETYVLKQQGHYYDMNVLAYSPDGQIIATGGDDGKVALS